MKQHPKGKGCWYLIVIRECPICGRTETWRERQWTPRPESDYDRYDYETTIGCGSHFL